MKLKKFLKYLPMEAVIKVVDVTDHSEKIYQGTVGDALILSKECEYNNIWHMVKLTGSLIDDVNYVLIVKKKKAKKPETTWQEFAKRAE